MVLKGVEELALSYKFRIAEQLQRFIAFERLHTFQI